MPEFAGIRQIESWAVAISTYVWGGSKRQKRDSKRFQLTNQARLIPAGEQ